MGMAVLGETRQQREQRRRKLECLGRVLRGCRRLLVLTHDNPDPDSIMAATGVQCLAEQRYRVPADVGYGGIVGRGENRALIEELGLPLLHTEDLAWADYDLIGLVDTQPRTGNNSLPPQRKADIVIDHHPMRRPTWKAAYHDVRRGYGATSTIVAEYLLHRRIALSRQMATGFFYAVKSETQNLGREASAADRRVYMRLFPLVDNALLSRIEHSPLTPGYFATLQRAIESTRLHGAVAISRLGAVDVPDNVSEFADLLLRIDRVAWAFCCGEYQGALYLSIRTEDRTADAGALIQQIVGRLGKAGGHGMIAGGRITGPTYPAGSREAQEAWLSGRLLRALDVDAQPGRPLIVP